MRKKTNKKNTTTFPISLRTAYQEEHSLAENHSLISVDFPAYKLAQCDCIFLTSATLLLQKALAGWSSEQDKVVSISKVLQVFSRLPKVTPGHDISVSIGSPLSQFGESESFHYWEFAIEDRRLSITGGGYFDRLRMESESFLVKWIAIPDRSPSFTNFLCTFSSVPDIRPLLDAVTKIEIESRLFEVRIVDPSNPMLADDWGVPV